MERYVFTCGDINGVGPEIALKVIQNIKSSKQTQNIIIIPANIFEEASELTGINLKYAEVKSVEELDNAGDGVVLFDIGKFRISPGKPTLSSGKAAYKALDAAMNIISAGLSNTLITLPISKKAMNLAGFKFPGHTEYLAANSSSNKFSMMFLSDKMKCALATIHEPVKKVPLLITRKAIEERIQTVLNSLVQDFRIESPRIAVLGLNPHAGEEGQIGNEEIESIIPAIKVYGKNVQGPFVPDAFFGKSSYKEYDCTIGMYHDQVLIPFKMLDFSGGVNYTAGLNFVRTSPDHGTAYDIAWTNKANYKSTLKAFEYAKQISKNRNRR